MLSEVPTLQELKIAKTVGLKAITRAVAKMYQLVLFRDSVDIDPKLVLKIVLAFCKQNNKFDADHYDALVADDGKELMLLTNELMATPQGKAYISELAREVRAVAPSLRCSPTLPRAEHPSLRPFPFSSARALATSQGRKETYSELYNILFNILYDGVKPRDLAAMNERHAYLFHHQEGEKDEEALFPICHALFRMTTTDDDSQEFSFPSKELHEAAKQLSTLFGNFTPGEPNQVTGEREPLVTANLLALCALVRPAPASALPRAPATSRKRSPTRSRSPNPADTKGFEPLRACSFDVPPIFGGFKSNPLTTRAHVHHRISAQQSNVAHIPHKSNNHTDTIDEQCYKKIENRILIP